MVHVDQHRRREEEAGPGDATAAGQRPRATSQCVRHLRVEVRERGVATCERADVGLLVERVPDHVAAYGVDERRDETVPDAVVHVDPLDRTAALAGVVEGAVRHGGGRGTDVDVVADVDGVLAAELELEPQEPRRHGGRHLDARRMRAGEADRIDALLDEHGADVAATHDGLEAVRGDARFMHQLGDRQTRQRGELARLVDDRIAGEQCRQEHVGGDEPGVVPRRDVGHHAERLALDAFLEPVGGADHLVGEDAADLGEEEFDPGEDARELPARLRDRLSHLEGQRPRERLGALDDQRAEAPDRLAACRKRRRGPRGLRRARTAARGGDRRPAGLGDVAQDVAGRRIDDAHGQTAKTRAQAKRKPRVAHSSVPSCQQIAMPRAPGAGIGEGADVGLELAPWSLDDYGVVCAGS